MEGCLDLDKCCTITNGIQDTIMVWIGIIMLLTICGYIIVKSLEALGWINKKIKGMKSIVKYIFKEGNNGIVKDSPIEDSFESVVKIVHEFSDKTLVIDFIHGDEPQYRLSLTKRKNNENTRRTKHSTK